MNPNMDKKQQYKIIKDLPKSQINTNQSTSRRIIAGQAQLPGQPKLRRQTATTISLDSNNNRSQKLQPSAVS